MHYQNPLFPLLLIPFLACSVQSDRERSVEGSRTTELLHVDDLAAAAGPDLLDFGILQKTCALYVAVRSSAWKAPLAFGREVDDAMVQWNTCPGGTMVACKKVTTADGDTILTGLPKPVDRTH
ncbi:MAG: hypothetical protein KDC00_04940 [Flavobacteriales bacterium]|nr:hypothetical protein [Flavobacteriales bacterium]